MSLACRFDWVVFNYLQLDLSTDLLSLIMFLTWQRLKILDLSCGGTWTFTLVMEM